MGHDPDLTELLGYLIDAAGVPLRKGALATVDVAMKPATASAATLRWLVPPDLLEKP